MKLPKISQSLMKAYVDYLNGKECGLFFQARYIDKDPYADTEPSDAMRAGVYFEYLCTGALPRNGVVPEPDVVYKGKPNEKLSAPYERIVESAAIFKKIIEHYDIKIKNIGLVLGDDEINGIIDIHAEWDGKEVFIDLKYSGLIDDKWSDTGWDLDALPQKDSLMIQGVHYKILAERCLNIQDIPFYYFVFSSTDPNNVKIIKQEVDNSKTQSHIVAVHNILGKIKKEIEFGFTPIPSLIKCSKCPLAFKCESKVDYPLIDEVYY
jgi:hypothetical protein